MKEFNESRQDELCECCFAIAVRQSRKDLMNYSSMGCVNGFEYCFAIAAGQSQKDLMI